MKLCIVVLWLCVGFTAAQWKTGNFLPDFFYRHIKHVSARSSLKNSPCYSVFRYVCPTGIDVNALGLAAGATSELEEWLSFFAMIDKNETVALPTQMYDATNYRKETFGLVSPYHSFYRASLTKIIEDDVPFGENLHNMGLLLTNLAKWHPSEREFMVTLDTFFGNMKSSYLKIANISNADNRINQAFQEVSTTLRERLKTIAFFSSQITDLGYFFKNAAHSFATVVSNTIGPYMDAVTVFRQLAGWRIAADKVKKDYYGLLGPHLDLANKLGRMKVNALQGDAYDRVLPVFQLLIDRVSTKKENTKNLVVGTAIMYGAVGTELMVEVLKKIGKYINSECLYESFSLLCKKMPDPSNCPKRYRVNARKNNAAVGEEYYETMALKVAFDAFEKSVRPSMTKQRIWMSTTIFQNEELTIGGMFFASRAMVRCNYYHLTTSTTESWGQRALIDAAAAQHKEFIIANKCGPRSYMYATTSTLCSVVAEK